MLLVLDVHNFFFVILLWHNISLFLYIFFIRNPGIFISDLPQIWGKNRGVHEEYEVFGVKTSYFDFSGKIFCNFFEAKVWFRLFWPTNQKWLFLQLFQHFQNLNPPIYITCQDSLPSALSWSPLCGGVAPPSTYCITRWKSQRRFSRGSGYSVVFTGKQNEKCERERALFSA